MRNLTKKKKKTNLNDYSASRTMDQLLKSRGKSGDSMVANLGEEDQTQKAREVQKEQQTEADTTDHPKSIPKVTNPSKELYIYIYIYLFMTNKLNKYYHLGIIVREM